MIDNKNLPHNIEIEKVILGSLIKSYKNVVYEIISDLTAEDFFLDKHKIIFNSIVSFFLKKDDNVDFVIIYDDLNKKKQLNEIGGQEYLKELVDSVLSILNIKTYVKLVKNYAILRNLFLEFNNIENDFLNKKFGKNYENIFQNIDKRINDILKKRNILDFKDSQTIIKLTRHHIEELTEISAKKKRGLTGIDTGFKKLNEYTNGFQKENLIVIAGRTGQGKTAFSLNLALNATNDNEMPIAIFELEMSAVSLFIRLLSCVSGIPQSKILSGTINDTDKITIENSSDDLGNRKIYVDESTSLTILDLTTKAMKLKEKEPNLGLIIIDYLGLISSVDDAYKKRRYDNRQLEIQEYTRALHELARKIKVPIILLCQLNRKADDRGGKPRLSDLRESGSIEQDADLVLLLHNDNNEEALKIENYINIIVAKNRHGKTGKFKLLFRKEYSQFVDTFVNSDDDDIGTVTDNNITEFN